MSFAYTVTKRLVKGSRRHAYGTFTNGVSDSGGTMVVMSKYVESFNCSVNSGLGSELPKITLNSATGSVELVTSTGADGTWEASGI